LTDELLAQATAQPAVYPAAKDLFAGWRLSCNPLYAASQKLSDSVGAITSIDGNVIKFCVIPDLECETNGITYI